MVFLFLESELVSGFMTEHAAVVFVFFFLAEYSSILLMCILTSSLFLGGYLFLLDLHNLFYVIDFISYDLLFDLWYINEGRFFLLELLSNPNLVLVGFLEGLFLGIKSSILVFIFIWVRASFPRIRFDQLMSFCWTVLLPIIFAFVILIPCILYSFDILPANSNIPLFSVLPLVLKVNKDSVNKNASFFNKVLREGDEQLVSRPTYKKYTGLNQDYISQVIKDELRELSGVISC